MKQDLLAYLLQREKFFVEEIDRLCFKPDSVQIFADEKFNGWLYLPGESQSADWNLARLIGRPQEAGVWLDQLPSHELQLLVPETALDFFPQFQQSSSLFWFESSIISVPKAQNMSGFEFKTRQKPNECKLFNGSFIEIYLLRQQEIVGLVKTIKETPRCTEVYIEVAPAWREKGLGSWLLGQMLAATAKLGKCLTYAVADDNPASLALARKMGLRQFNRLLRLVSRK